jgi:hypothetical protein
MTREPEMAAWWPRVGKVLSRGKFKDLPASCGRSMRVVEAGAGGAR